MDYQKYLMEIGASSKLVKMGAVIETMYKLKPTLEEIVLDDYGQIILLLDSEIVKFSLNGNGAKIERKEIYKNDNKIKISYVDEFGIEYISGYSNINKETYIDKDYRYIEKTGKFVDTHDDSVSITIQGTDFGKRYNHDGSCLLQYINEYSINTDADIKNKQMTNMVKTIIKYPLSTLYYIKNNYITKDNMNDELIEGISSIIKIYRNFIKINGKQKYPTFLNGLLDKTDEQVKDENEQVAKEIDYYLNVMNEIKNNNKIIDATENYTDEIAKERRSLYLDKKDIIIDKKIIEARENEQAAKVEYEQLLSILEQGANNIIFRKQVAEVLRQVSRKFNETHKIDLSYLNVSEDSLNSYEIVYQLKLSQKVYKSASNIIKDFLGKHESKSLLDLYFNKIFNELSSEDNKSIKRK